MKRNIIPFLLIFRMCMASDNDDDIFMDYCRSDLCKYTGGDGAHSGCKDGVLHNGKFQYPPCSENAALIPLTDAEKQYILDVHNIQRNYVACGGLYKKYALGPGCRHGVVTWDKELEKTAFLHTSYCTFAHDKCRNTLKYPFTGQNLGLLTYDENPLNATLYINIISYLWYVEHYYTKMDVIDHYYHQKEFMIGHFLTSLNERNNRIGCTFAQFLCNERKKNIVMLSCNYPTTNIARGTIYNSCKKPASKCTSGTDPKYKFLCSSKEKYDVSGVLKHIPYDGNGSEVFANCGRQAELYHYEQEGADDIRQQHKKLYPDFPMPVEQLEGQTTKKPITVTTKKPMKKPPLDSPHGNPNAGGIPDYSEDEYDPIDSSSSTFWQKRYSFIFISMQVCYRAYFISAVLY